jgi:hypothetical protein
MDNLPARTGWLWIKDGFALYRKQPAEMSTLFMCYLFMLFAPMFIPLLGPIVLMVLMPALSMCFMQACLHLEQNKRVYPNLLLTGFRRPVFSHLVKLGFVYLLAVIIATVIAILLDDGYLWKTLPGLIERKDKIEPDPRLLLSLFIYQVTYLICQLPLWYAAPLIVWQKMSVAKSIFYSFFSVKRNAGAFIVYFLGWLVIGGLLPNMAGAVIGLLVGPQLSTFLLLPVLLIILTILFCSVYPTYTSLFGRPDEPSTSSQPISPDEPSL